VALGGDAVLRQLGGRLDALQAQGGGRLVEQGFREELLQVERFLNLR